MAKESDFPVGHSPEKTAETAIRVVDWLYYGHFRQVMNPDVFNDFREFLTVVAAQSHPMPAGKVAIQLFMAETHAELSEPDGIPWLGIGYDASFEEEAVHLKGTGWGYPPDRRDISELPQFEDNDTFVLKWHDVNWTAFDWTHGVYED
jgi:hypothetical protein